VQCGVVKAERAAGLPRECRLRQRAEFERLKESGGRFTSRHWILQFAAGGYGTASRLGVLTTRRSGKSHDRVRLRRLAREFFRVRKKELAAPQDVVLIARAGAWEADNATLRAELAQLWEKLAGSCRK